MCQGRCNTQRCFLPLQSAMVRLLAAEWSRAFRLACRVESSLQIFNGVSHHITAEHLQKFTHVFRELTSQVFKNLFLCEASLGLCLTSLGRKYCGLVYSLHDIYVIASFVPTAVGLPVLLTNAKKTGEDKTFCLQEKKRKRGVKSRCARSFRIVFMFSFLGSPF